MCVSDRAGEEISAIKESGDVFPAHLNETTHLRTEIVCLFPLWTAVEASPALLVEQFGVGLHSGERLAGTRSAASSTESRTT